MTDTEAAAEWVPVEALHAWSRNPRLIDDAQISRVAESIKRFGFSAPIVARRQDGEVIAGHTRLRAAQKLGLPKVPVRYMDLDPAEAHLLALADNRLTELTPWNQTELSSLLSEYGLADAGTAGWSSADLDELATDLIKAGGGGDGEGAEEDEVPDPPKVPVTRPGDLWVLGDHRLVCGDSTDPRVWAQLMADEAERFDLVFTDPPYGIDYFGGNHEIADRSKIGKPVHNDGAEGLPRLLSEVFDALVLHCRPGAAWYVFAPPGPNMLVFAQALAQRDIWRQSISWVKDSLVFGRSDYHYQHEQIFYGWVPGGPHRPPADRKQTTVWNFDRPKKSEQHPTMKPIKLVAHALGNSSVKGELVGDPFGGSGTTLVASQQLERRCRTIEIGPEYCDVIVERWEQVSSEKAKLVRQP